MPESGVLVLAHVPDQFRRWAFCERAGWSLFRPTSLVSPGSVTTEGPMWGYPRGRFWDLGTVLEPFCGKLLPQVDKPVKN